MTKTLVGAADEPEYNKGGILHFGNAATFGAGSFECNMANYRMGALTTGSILATPGWLVISGVTR